MKLGLLAFILFFLFALQAGELSQAELIKKSGEINQLLKEKSGSFTAQQKAAIARQLEEIQQLIDGKKINVQRERTHNFLSDFFDDDFFNGRRDPFGEMEKMHEKLRKMFDESSSDFDDSFKGWYGNKFGGDIGEISFHEDERNIYYEINIPDVNKDSIKIKIQGGAINLSGEVVTKNDSRTKNGLSQSQSISRISRSIPLPPFVDEDKVKIDSQKDRIVLTFPKKQRASVFKGDMI